MTVGHWASEEFTLCECRVSGCIHERQATLCGLSRGFTTKTHQIIWPNKLSTAGWEQSDFDRYFWFGHKPGEESEVTCDACILLFLAQSAE